VRAENVKIENGKTTFDVVIRHQNQTTLYRDMMITLMGKHNILNTLASVAVAFVVGIGEDFIRQALASFEGIKRRLTLRGCENNISVYDDYAHHPSEIRASLSALKDHISGRLVAIFQPHRYTRFQNLWTDFMDAFDLADAVFVTDVYSAGDEAIEGVNTSNFVSQMQKIRSNVFETTTENFAQDVASFVQSGDTVVCLNAGSLSRQIPELLEVLKK
jgi:UDP-N-acetylmuramate--alanine ligase